MVNSIDAQRRRGSARDSSRRDRSSRGASRFRRGLGGRGRSMRMGVYRRTHRDVHEGSQGTSGRGLRGRSREVALVVAGAAQQPVSGGAVARTHVPYSGTIRAPRLLSVGRPAAGSRSRTGRRAYCQCSSVGRGAARDTGPGPRRRSSHANATSRGAHGLLLPWLSADAGNGASNKHRAPGRSNFQRHRVSSTWAHRLRAHAGIANRCRVVVDGKGRPCVD